MKRSIIILVAAVMGISSCMMSISSVKPIKGNGNLTTLEKTVSTFDKIDCAGSAEVRFHAGEKFHAVVTIDENLEEYIEIVTKNNVLNIGNKNGCSISPTKFTVDVYCPVLTGVSISGSGSFKNAEKITVSTFKSSIAGSGTIEGAIECGNYSASITGSGSIRLQGNINDANISITGSGNFNGNELNTKNTTIAITGSGNANICVSDNLKAKITGSGNINYSGNPKTDLSITGSGRIKNL